MLVADDSSGQQLAQSAVPLFAGPPLSLCARMAASRCLPTMKPTPSRLYRLRGEPQALCEGRISSLHREPRGVRESGSRSGTKACIHYQQRSRREIGGPAAAVDAGKAADRRSTTWTRLSASERRKPIEFYEAVHPPKATAEEKDDSAAGAGWNAVEQADLSVGR